MKKFVWLMILTLGFMLSPSPAAAQDGQKVAVMPFVLSAEGAQLEQLSRLSKGLTGMVVDSLASQGFVPIAMSDSVLTSTDQAVKAQAADLGADYILYTNVTKSGERFNMTGQLVALNSRGRSSQRVSATAEASTGLPQTAERMVLMATDHLYGGGARVASVSVTGNTMVDSQAILNALRIRQGGTYNDAKATSDIKRIYGMGFFEDVRVETRDVSGGKAVHFVVVERAQLGGIVFRGNSKLDDDDLLEKLGIKPYDIPSEKAIADSVNHIKNLYIEKGYPQAQVVTLLEPGDEGRQILVYEIDEGGKIFIRKIEFDGNDYYSDWTLSRKIDSSTKGFFSWLTSSGRVIQERLSGDAQKLESFYQNNGFLQARVGDPQVTTADNGGLIVTFPISEGDRYKVGTVSITGDLLPDDDPDKMLKMVSLRKATWFSREVLQEDLKSLQDYYADKGYAYNSIEPDIAPGLDETTLDLELVVFPNNQVYFDRITIVGNEKTRDKVVRRQLSVVEGDLYSSSAIQASQANLMRSTFFEQVNLVPGPSDTDDKMNLRVEVKERPTGSFQIGGGYSNYNSMFGVVRLTQDNLFGYGRRVALEGNFGSKNSYYNFSFTDPWVFDIPLTLGLDLFRYENKYDDYTKESTGAAIRAGYPVWGNFYLSARYSLEKIDITDVDDYASEYLKSMQDYKTDSVLTVSLRRDTRNHFFFPTEGTTARLSYSYGSGLFGGDTYFSRYEAEGAVWIPAPFFKGASLMAHGEVGYMKENRDEGLPVYEKYMIGGINSVRGYDWYSISPRDKATDEAIGGEKMMVFNFELAFPLLREEGLYAVAFYDMGNVWSKDGSYSFGDMRRSYGGGLRYLSPMGPFRIEYGRALDRERDEDKAGQWEFTMGSMF
ncbi:outer membrane protein assembly factor BamA [Deltaproteobacteria bacterium Smac51]|nr:outer membrane protein assembly factor BamA [Deltaproteobacteria bacterium Smac51]